MLMQKIMEWAVKRKWRNWRISEDYKVEDYLKKIPEYFASERAGDRKLTVVYEFHDSGDNNGVWVVTIADGKCSLVKGEAGSYDTLLYMTAESYRRILNGRLDFARLAYSVGAIRFFGNTLGHRELNDYLNIPKEAGIAAL